MTRLYIPGPCSGLPDNNYPAFNAAAAALRARGYEVENPAENAAQPDWASYMRCALEQMLRCDEVHLLPGWEQSSGAVWEASIAHGLGMPLRVCVKETHEGRMLSPWELGHLVALPAPGALREAAKPKALHQSWYALDDACAHEPLPPAFQDYITQSEREAAKPWDTNPFVWAIEFERVKP